MTNFIYRFLSDWDAANYCGSDESCSGVALGTVAGAAAGAVFRCAPGAALCDTGVNDAPRGAAASVVIALSGFSKWS